MTTAPPASFRASFVRHAKVTVDLAVPSTQWRLASGFERDLTALLPRLRATASGAVWTSPEHKARGCAQFLADSLGFPVREAAGLAEHCRDGASRPASRTAFEALMAEFFRRPGDLVFGTETASAALARITAAMEHIRSHEADGAIIVTHGTVLSLFLARHDRGRAFEIWKRLRMPDLVEIDL